MKRLFYLWQMFHLAKGDKGTGGVGGKITPSAVLVIKNGSSKLISVRDQDGLSRIIDMVPDIVNKFTNKNEDFGDFKTEADA